MIKKMKKLKNKKLLFIIALVFALAVIYFLSADFVQAQNVGVGATTPQMGAQISAAIPNTNTVGNGIAEFLAHVVMLLASAVGKILMTFVSILIWLASYNEFVDSRAVAIGWVVVRDLANIFFVLIMLLIAFGTLFNIQTYEYKKLLPKLLIAVILVNFSKMIVGVFIDFGQVIMLTFVHNFEKIAAGAVVNGLGVKSMFELANKLEGLNNINYWSIFGAAALALVMLIIACVTILAMIVVLLFRIIMLWVLVIFSPFAFVASLIPNNPLQKVSMFAQYWGNLSKYIIIGPILAFFLWLSFSILMQVNKETEQHIIALTRSQANTAGRTGTDPQYAEYLANKVSSPQMMFDFMVTIALLIGSLTITQQMGVMGGSFGMQAVGKMKSMAQKAGMAAALFAPERLWGTTKQKYNEATSKLLETSEGGKPPGWGKKVLFAALNPVAAARGWEVRSEELKKRSQEVAAARGREVTEQFRTGGKVRIPYAEQLESSFESQFAKDFTQMDKEQKAYMARLLYGRKDTDSRRRWRALIKVTAEEGQIDDIMLDKEFIKTVQGKRNGLTYGQEYTKAKEGEKQDENGYKLDDRGEKTKSDIAYNYQAVHEFFGETLGKDQNGIRLLKELEDIGKKSTHQEYGGHQAYNTKTGAWKVNSLEDAYRTAVVEFNKTPGRSRFAQSPHTYMELTTGFKYREEVDKETGEKKWVKTDEPVVRAGDMDEYHQQAFLATFAGDSAGHIKEHTQGRTLLMMLGGDAYKSNLDDDKYAHIDTGDLERFKHILQEAPQALYAAYSKAGGKEGNLKFKYHYVDERGEEQVTEIENEDELRTKFLGMDKMTEADVSQRKELVNRSFKREGIKEEKEESGAGETKEKIIESQTEIDMEQRKLKNIQESTVTNEEKEKQASPIRESIAEKEKEIMSTLQPAVADNMISGLSQNDFDISPDSVRNLGDTLANAVQESLKGVETGTADYSKVSDALKQVAKQFKEEKNKIPLETIGKNIDLIVTNILCFLKVIMSCRIKTR